VAWGNCGGSCVTKLWILVEKTCSPIGTPSTSSISNASSERMSPRIVVTSSTGIITGTMIRSRVFTGPAPATREDSSSEASRFRNAGVSSITLSDMPVVARWTQTMPQ